MNDNNNNAQPTAEAPKAEEKKPEIKLTEQEREEAIKKGLREAEAYIARRNAIKAAEKAAENDGPGWWETTGKECAKSALVAATTVGAVVLVSYAIGKFVGNGDAGADQA